MIQWPRGQAHPPFLAHSLIVQPDTLKRSFRTANLRGSHSSTGGPQYTMPFPGSEAYPAPRGLFSISHGSHTGTQSALYPLADRRSSAGGVRNYDDDFFSLHGF